MSLEELTRNIAAATMRRPFRMWGFGEGIALRGLLAACKATGNAEYLGFVQGFCEPTWAGEWRRPTRNTSRPVRSCCCFTNSPANRRWWKRHESSHS